MFSLPSASQRRNRSGFTLLELLVVITIIAILAGIILSVFGAVQNRARKVQAVNDMRNSKTAIISYYTDYQKYPLNDAQYNAGVLYGLGDTIYGDPGANSLYTSADLFNILRAVADARYNSNNVLNPNQVVYWSGGFVKNASKPREGISTQDVTLSNGDKIPKGSLVDPWGNSYVFFVDADRDGDLSKIIHAIYSDVSDTPGTVKLGPPPLGIGTCSLGPDGVLGTKVGANGNGKLKNSDDIVTWQ